MPRTIRSIVLLLAAIMIFPGSGAQAEFSPRLTDLLQHQGIQIELGATFDVMEPLSENSLAVINDWLSRIRVHLAGEEGVNRQITRARVTLDQQEIFGVTTQEQPAYTLSIFAPSGGAYLTGSGEKDPLSLLSGGSVPPPSLTVAAQAYQRWAPYLYPLLEEMVTSKEYKTSTSIKNSDSAQSYVNYIFKADEMNAAWPQIMDTLLPALKETMAQQPEWYEAAEKMLEQLVFSGECRFKRFLNKQGEDMGLQFTGNAGIGEDVRKVTLFGGYTPDKGGYISLALPAVKGRNNFKITLTGKLTQKSTQNTLTLEGTYTRTMDDKTHTASMEASLKNALKDGNETWSGKITLTNKQDGVTDTYTLTPALAFTDEGLQGEMAIQHKQGSKTRLKCAVAMVMQESDPIDPPLAIAAKDLRGMEESRARAVAAEELISLTRALMQLLTALPEESRILLTHELRTDDWMNGPVVPLSGKAGESSPQDETTVPEENQQTDAYSPWIVEEEYPMEKESPAEEGPWIVEEDPETDDGIPGV